MTRIIWALNLRPYIFSTPEEVQCILAIQLLVKRLEHPPGLFTSLLGQMYNSDVVKFPAMKERGFLTLLRFSTMLFWHLNNWSKDLGFWTWKKKHLKIAVTYFHNLQILKFISNSLYIRINNALQIWPKREIIILRKYPYVRVGTQVSMCITDILN